MAQSSGCRWIALCEPLHSISAARRMLATIDEHSIYSRDEALSAAVLRIASSAFLEEF
jgi:hypothetical protein